MPRLNLFWKKFLIYIYFFYEFIIDIIKKKNQMIFKTMIARTFNTLMIKEKNEIWHLFALIYNNIDNGD